MTPTKWLHWMTALATALLLSAICWQCIDIYLTGNSPENLDANGVHIESVFRMDDVASRLKPLIIPTLAYVCLVAATLVADQVTHSPTRKVRHILRKHHPQQMKVCYHALPSKSILLIRVFLYALAIGFIVLGVMNGGLRDVLIKAINICTECIGLG